MNFKDPASPFAEALIELHHNIMFYLIVIVSVVLYMLIKIIFATRVVEPYNSFINLSIFSFIKMTLFGQVFYFIWLNFFIKLDNKILSESYIKFLKFFSYWFIARGFYFSLLNKVLAVYKLKNYLYNKIKIYYSKVIDFFTNFVNSVGLSTFNRPSIERSFSFFYKSTFNSFYWSYILKITKAFELFSLSKKVYSYLGLSKALVIFKMYGNLNLYKTNKLNFFNLMTPHKLLNEDVNKIPNFVSEMLILNKNQVPALNVFLGSNELYKNNLIVESLSANKNYSFLYSQSLTMHNTTLEIVWTIVPTLILILIAIPSFILLYSLDEVINPSITLKAIGHQWYWSYEYSDYTNENSLGFDSYMIPESDLMLGQFRLLEVDNRVILPVNTHIRVLVTSGDVLHAWALPNMTIKADAVPGRLNQLNLFIKRPGVYYGQCSELCGVNHGFMPIVVETVSLWNYSNWLTSRFSDAGIEVNLE